MSPRSSLGGEDTPAPPVADTSPAHDPNLERKVQKTQEDVSQVIHCPVEWQHSSLDE